MNISYVDFSIDADDPSRRAPKTALRRRVWMKTRGRCWYCGIELDESFHCDHMDPFSRGGPTSYDNLVPSCASCNFIKSDRTVSEFERFLDRHRALNRMYERGEIPPLTFPRLCKEQGISLECAARIVKKPVSVIRPMYDDQIPASAWVFLQVLESLEIPWQLNKRYRDAKSLLFRQEAA